MMKKISMLSAILLFSTIGAYAQKIDETYGKPLIILIERNPWLMVIGSDTPTFVLYEKGQIIYKRSEGDKVTAYQVVLSPSELKRVIDGLEIKPSFYELPDRIAAARGTDQPTNTLVVTVKTVKRVDVYGNLRTPHLDRDTSPPADFLNLYNKLISFKHESEKIWEPQVMEVMLWDYSYAPNKKPWPKTLPDLSSPTTVKFRDDMYSIFLQRSQFEEFRKFYASLEERTAVEINGKKMSISARYPFPNLN